MSEKQKRLNSRRSCHTGSVRRKLTLECLERRTVMTAVPGFPALTEIAGPAILAESHREAAAHYAMPLSSERPNSMPGPEAVMWKSVASQLAGRAVPPAVGETNALLPGDAEFGFAGRAPVLVVSSVIATGTVGGNQLLSVLVIDVSPWDTHGKPHPSEPIGNAVLRWNLFELGWFNANLATALPVSLYSATSLTDRFDSSSARLSGGGPPEGEPLSGIRLSLVQDPPRAGKSPQNDGIQFSSEPGLGPAMANGVSRNPSGGPFWDGSSPLYVLPSSGSRLDPLGNVWTVAGPPAAMWDVGHWARQSWLTASTTDPLTTSTGNASGILDWFSGLDRWNRERRTSLLAIPNYLAASSADEITEDLQDAESDEARSLVLRKRLWISCEDDVLEEGFVDISLPFDASLLHSDDSDGVPDDAEPAMIERLQAADGGQCDAQCERGENTLRFQVPSAEVVLESGDVAHDRSDAEDNVWADYAAEGGMIALSLEDGSVWQPNVDAAENLSSIASRSRSSSAANDVIPMDAEVGMYQAMEVATSPDDASMTSSGDRVALASPVLKLPTQSCEYRSPDTEYVSWGQER